MSLLSQNLRGALPDCDDLSKVKLVVVHLGDENGCHGLIECCAVHVDGGPDGQHEADDASVDVVVLEEALEGDRQSGRAATQRGGKKQTNNYFTKERQKSFLT